ncbi:MAG: tyrosine recombinase XerC [Ruminococcaceae bacterium]|nr:tyrosine recombinase XerC [Oscillospiraceae bacterium]
MQDYSDAPSLVRKYLNYKDTAQNRSQKTVFQYYHDLRTFSRFLLVYKIPDKYSSAEFSEIPFSDMTDDMLLKVTSNDIYEFISYCSRTLDNGVSARHRKLSCIRTFYKYLSKTLLVIKENPAEAIDSPKTPKKLPKYLSLDESKQLLSSVSGSNAIRDYCIITLFLNCGMRVSELVGIDLSHISDDFSTVNVTGKGSKERLIYLNDACKSALEAYLKVRPKDAKHKDRNALFISRNKNRLSVQSVQLLIYKHLKAAGLGNRNMSVHKLRHTAATLMYQYGKTDVRVLKDILGHEQLSTTQIYTHVNNEMIREAVNENPLAGIKPQKVHTKNDNNED